MESDKKRDREGVLVTGELLCSYLLSQHFLGLYFTEFLYSYSSYCSGFCCLDLPAPELKLCMLYSFDLFEYSCSLSLTLPASRVSRVWVLLFLPHVTSNTWREFEVASHYGNGCSSAAAFLPHGFTLFEALWQAFVFGGAAALSCATQLLYY